MKQIKEEHECKVQIENNMLIRMNEEERRNREVWFQEGRKQALEEELKFLEFCYKRFPHNVLEQRIDKIKSKIKKELKE